MKKIIMIFSLLICIFGLSSCSSKYKSKKKFPNDVLKQFEIKGMPKIKASDGVYEETLTTPRLFLTVDEAEFNSYAGEVYQFLRDKNFSYFGYRGLDYSAFTEFDVYKFETGESVEDFKMDGINYYGYNFIYSSNDELTHENLILDSTCLMMVYYPDTQTHVDKNEKKGNFEYNCLITFSDNYIKYFVAEE